MDCPDLLFSSLRAEISGPEKEDQYFMPKVTPKVRGSGK